MRGRLSYIAVHDTRLPDGISAILEASVVAKKLGNRKYTSENAKEREFFSISAISAGRHSSVAVN